MQILVRKIDNVVINVASDGYALSFDKEKHILYRRIRVLPASAIINNYTFDGSNFKKINPYS